MEVKGKRSARAASRDAVRRKRGANLRADGQEPDKRLERRTSGPVTTKSISNKVAESKSGGCAGKAHELTSGDLLRVLVRRPQRAEDRDWESREANRTRSRSQQRAK